MIKKQKGFTLIELLIVIVIVGVLAAIAIVVYSGIQEKARIAAHMTAIDNLAELINVANVANKNAFIGKNGSEDACVYAKPLYESCDEMIEKRENISGTVTEHLHTVIRESGATPEEGYYFFTTLSRRYSGPEGAEYEGAYIYTVLPGDIECPGISVPLFNRTFASDSVVGGPATTCRYKLEHA